jgi:hypothetical protein
LKVARRIRVIVPTLKGARRIRRMLQIVDKFEYGANNLAKGLEYIVATYPDWKRSKHGLLDKNKGERSVRNKIKVNNNT